MRSNVVAVLVCGVAVGAGCKQPGPDLALGPPATFRLAQFRDRLNIGIDLEIRLPAGYESDASQFRRAWHRGRDIVIDVTTNPEEQVKLETPCGVSQDDFGRTNSVAARTGNPDDLTIVCEYRDNKELKSVRVVRLIRSIDTVIQCKAAAVVRLVSTEERAAQLAICGSLRVLGRSTWTPADYLPPGSESLKK